MRAIGFNLGLRGDIVISSVVARSFKEQYPDSALTLGLGPEFADMMPLFAHHPYYDDCHVYSIYDGWPSEKDREYLLRAKYDLVFNGFPPHRDTWYQNRHQYANAVHICGLPIPSNINPILTKWFDVRDDLKDVVAFAPFAGFYNPLNDKMLPPDVAQAIVWKISKRGFRVLQLGGRNEPELSGAMRFDTDYFGSVKNMLACRALVHADTGMGHVAGAYNHPSLGLFAYRYYGKKYAKNIRPIHTNFLSVEADRIGEISLDEVSQSIDTLLS